MSNDEDLTNEELKLQRSPHFRLTSSDHPNSERNAMRSPFETKTNGNDVKDSSVCFIPVTEGSYPARFISEEQYNRYADSKGEDVPFEDSDYHLLLDEMKTWPKSNADIKDRGPFGGATGVPLDKVIRIRFRFSPTCSIANYHDVMKLHAEMIKSQMDTTHGTHGAHGTHGVPFVDPVFRIPFGKTIEQAIRDHPATREYRTQICL